MEKHRVGVEPTSPHYECRVFASRRIFFVSPAAKRKVACDF